MRTTLKLLISLAVFSFTWVAHAHDMVPQPAQDNPILLINGTIHTVTGATIQEGQILFEDGKITAVRNLITPPENCEIIDVTGRHIYPGLISSISSIGLAEISSIKDTIDTGELGHFNPNIRAEVGVNPDSEVIPVTRANGVLVAHVSPIATGAGMVAGTSAIMKLDGWTTEDMTLQAPIALRIKWPRDPQNNYFQVDSRTVENPQKEEENYGKAIQLLDDMFTDAHAFWKAKETEKIHLEVNLRLEAMGPVLNRTIPVHVSANSARQIRDAVYWASRQNVNLVIVGGRDAWRVAEVLAENHVPVIIGEVNTTATRRWESYDTGYKNAALLHQAGVIIAIAYGGGGPNAANERNLPYEAGKAVAFGLPKEEALKAITIYPAEILGVADRLGSLEVGKDATLFVSTGDPLDIRSNVELAFIDGRPIELSSRHTQLYEKYQTKYQQK
jgi:imidazolonepropionase-like amidohydrolase